LPRRRQRRPTLLALSRRPLRPRNRSPKMVRARTLCVTHHPVIPEVHHHVIPAAFAKASASRMHALARRSLLRRREVRLAWPLAANLRALLSGTQETGLSLSLLGPGSRPLATLTRRNSRVRDDNFGEA